MHKLILHTLNKLYLITSDGDPLSHILHVHTHRPDH